MYQNKCVAVSNIMCDDCPSFDFCRVFHLLVVQNVFHVNTSYQEPLYRLRLSKPAVIGLIMEWISNHIQIEQRDVITCPCFV